MSNNVVDQEDDGPGDRQARTSSMFDHICSGGKTRDLDAKSRWERLGLRI
jgi:hypothetical protein